jgi:hypothetical protein
LASERLLRSAFYNGYAIHDATLKGLVHGRYIDARFSTGTAVLGPNGSPPDEFGRYPIDFFADFLPNLLEQFAAARASFQFRLVDFGSFFQELFRTRSAASFAIKDCMFMV